MPPRLARSSRRCRPPWPDRPAREPRSNRKGCPHRAALFACRTPMSDDLDALKADTEAALAAATDLRAWDAVRVAVLGRNGTLTQKLKELGATAPELRRERGAALNRLRDELSAAIEARRAALDEAA